MARGAQKPAKNKRAAAPSVGRSTSLTRGGPSREELALKMKVLAQKADMTKLRERSEVLDEPGSLEKEELENVPFFICHVDRRRGDYGAFVVVHCIVEETREIVFFTDGGVGIASMLEGKDPTPETPMYVPGGLRVSKYNHPQHGPAETWYLSGQKRKNRGAGANGAAQAQRSGGRGRAVEQQGSDDIPF